VLQYWPGYQQTVCCKWSSGRNAGSAGRGVGERGGAVLHATGAKIFTQVVNVAVRADLESEYQKIREQWGQVSIVIANAYACEFLCSDKGSYITGQEINVNGGSWM